MMSRGNIIKSYQVKKIEKRKVIAFDEELDYISSVGADRSLASEAQKHQQTLERLEEEIENSRKELVLLREEIEKIKKEKQELISKIEEEGRQNAEKLKDKLLSEYREEGYKKGVEEGKAEIERRFLEFKNYIEELEKKLESGYKEYSEKYFEEELALIFAILKKILKTEKLKEELEETVKNNYLLIKKQLEDGRKYDVFINEEDYQKMKEFLEEMFASSKELMPGLYPSSRVEKGGCIVETNFGTLEVTPQSELEDIYKYFLENLLLQKESN